MTLRQERFGIVALVLICFVLRCAWLPSNPVNDKYDEGVYVSMMQGVAAGKGVLYRDYILCHPPGIILAGAWLWPFVKGDITTLRMIYIVLSSLSLLPLYALSRRLYGPKGALCVLLLLATSPGFANWLGQIIVLDPLLNVVVALALWAITKALHIPAGRAAGDSLSPLAPSGRGAGGEGQNRHTPPTLLALFLVGMLIGSGYLLKETALPVAVSIGAGLLFVPGFFAGRWKLLLAFSAGVALTFAPLLLALSHLPNYLHYTFGYNARDPYDWGLRPYELMNGFYGLPFLLTFGVLGVWRMLRHANSREERFLAVYAVTFTVFMLLVPRRFYWRYLMPALPVYCLGVWVWWSRFQARQQTAQAERQEAKRNGRPAGTGGRLLAMVFGVLFGLVHLAGLILYRTHEGRNPPEYAEAVRVVRASPGPLFALDYLWHPLSGHPVTPDVQQLVRDTIHVPVSAEQYTAVASQCPTLLLNKETGYWLPRESERLLRLRYRTVFRYGEPGESRYLEILQQRPGAERERPEAEGQRPK